MIVEISSLSNPGSPPTAQAFHDQTLKTKTQASNCCPYLRSNLSLTLKLGHCAQGHHLHRQIHSLLKLDAILEQSAWEKYSLFSRRVMNTCIYFHMMTVYPECIKGCSNSIHDASKERPAHDDDDKSQCQTVTNRSIPEKILRMQIVSGFVTLCN